MATVLAPVLKLEYRHHTFVVMHPTVRNYSNPIATLKPYSNPCSMILYCRYSKHSIIIIYAIKFVGSMTDSHDSFCQDSRQT